MSDRKKKKRKGAGLRLLPSPDGDESDLDRDDGPAEVVEGEVEDRRPGNAVSAGDDPLTTAEVALVREYVMKGPPALAVKRWDASQQAAFLSRQSVILEIRRYDQLIEHGETVVARQAFVARLQLGDMLPLALEVIRRHLRGLLPDADGRTQSAKDLPDADQVATAWQILDKCGVNSQLAKQLSITNVLNVDLSPQRDSTESYDMFKVLSREKARNALEAITAKIRKAETAKTELSDARAVRRGRSDE